jgi:hypothetical protein
LQKAQEVESSIEIVSSGGLIRAEAESGDGEAAEDEKNDEKMALQSIYEAAFTEKIPGMVFFLGCRRNELYHFVGAGAAK